MKPTVEKRLEHAEALLDLNRQEYFILKKLILNLRKQLDAERNVKGDMTPADR